MAETFPSLSINPSFPLGEKRLDNALVSTSDHGYVHGRMKFTRDRRVWSVVYEGLTSDDKDDLDTLVGTVGKAVSFSWTHPVTEESHTVRFLTLPEYSYGRPSQYDTQFELCEA